MSTRESNQILQTLPFFDLLQNIAQCFFSCGGSFHLISCSCVNTRTTAHLTFFFPALLLVATLSQLLHRSVFLTISFFCGLIYQNVYATTDLKEVFWFWCTAQKNLVGESGSEMEFSDGEETWLKYPAGKLCVTLTRTMHPQTEKWKWPQHEAAVKPQLFSFCLRVKSRLIKVMSHPASSRNCDWKTRIKLMLLQLLEY